jgi:Na+/proline symporter
MEQHKIAILAGLGLQALLQPLMEKSDRETSARHAVFAKRLWTVALATLGAILFWTFGRSFFFELMRGFYPDLYEAPTQLQLDTMRFNKLLADVWIVGLILCAGLSMLALAYSKKISATAAAIALTLLTLIDLWIVDKKIGEAPVPQKNISSAR